MEQQALLKELRPTSPVWDAEEAGEGLGAAAELDLADGLHRLEAQLARVAPDKVERAERAAQLHSKIEQLQQASTQAYRDACDHLSRDRGGVEVRGEKGSD